LIGCFILKEIEIICLTRRRRVGMNMNIDLSGIDFGSFLPAIFAKIFEQRSKIRSATSTSNVTFFGESG
jgi:hypothetical protein